MSNGARTTTLFLRPSNKALLYSLAGLALSDSVQAGLVPVGASLKVFHFFPKEELERVHRLKTPRGTRSQTLKFCALYPRENPALLEERVSFSC